MKCKKCGLEMEMWQSRFDGVLIERYRCVCGHEESKTIDAKSKHDVKPSALDKEEKE